MSKEIDKHSYKKIHFILGIGGSGTSVLIKILNSYKNIHCMPEANFLVFFLNQFSRKNKFTEKDIYIIFKQIELYSFSHPWIGWNFNIEEVKNVILEIIKSKKEITYQELCSLIYKQFQVDGINKATAGIIIDKNPSFTIFVKQISKNFPQSKFIWIVRDYRANILSKKQNTFFLQSTNVAYNAIRWKLYNKIAYKFYKHNKDKMILVHYEDLVSNNQTIETILSFLSINPKDKEVDNVKTININSFNVEEKYRERFIKKYSELNKALNSNRVNTWQEQLPKSEITVCDAICCKIANFIGYKPIAKVSFFIRIQIFIYNFIPICFGYFDIIKDKLLFYFPVELKLYRLRKKYVKLGFIKK